MKYYLYAAIGIVFSFEFCIMGGTKMGKYEKAPKAL